VKFYRLNLTSNAAQKIVQMNYNDNAVNMYTDVSQNPDVQYNRTMTRALVMIPSIFTDNGFGSVLQNSYDYVYLVDLTNGSYKGISNRARSVAWSPDGQQFALGDTTKNGLSVLDLDGNVIQTIPMPPQGILNMVGLTPFHGTLIKQK